MPIRAPSGLPVSRGLRCADDVERAVFPEQFMADRAVAEQETLLGACDERCLLQRSERFSLAFPYLAPRYRVSTTTRTRTIRLLTPAII